MGLKKPIKTGSVLPSLDELSAVDATPVEAGGYVVLDTVPGQACTMESNTPISIKAELGKFGDATAADVVSGKMFTSSEGLKVAGSAPTLAEQTPGTAKPINITKDKTAWVNGYLVTGTSDAVLLKDMRTYLVTFNNSTINLKKIQYNKFPSNPVDNSKLTATSHSNGTKLFDGVTLCNIIEFTTNEGSTVQLYLQTDSSGLKVGINIK